MEGEGGRKGGREGGREGGRKGGKEGKRERSHVGFYLCRSWPELGERCGFRHFWTFQEVPDLPAHGILWSPACVVQYIQYKYMYVAVKKAFP